MKNHKRFYWLTGLLLLVGLLLAACKGNTTQATATHESIPQPTSPPPALHLAQLALGQQLGLEPAAISIVSAEPVEWPDACLGIHAPGKLCAQIVVPGYLVILEAAGQRYEYRTNTDGTDLQAVPGPTPPLGGLAITWQANNQCQTAIITEQGVTYGPCAGKMTSIALPGGENKIDLNQFADDYAPFYAATEAGELNFAGRGDGQATAAEERMLAEWARLTVESVVLGEAETVQRPAITWHREGGIAGFCDNLIVDVTGKATAMSCNEGAHQELGQSRLNGQQLIRLYTWVDTLKPFEMVQTEPAAADKMTIQLSFTGRGTLEATSSNQQDTEAFAAQLFAELAAAGAPQSLGDPDLVVSALLDSLQQDPSGESSLDYLSQSLQAFTESGHPLTETLDVEGIYRSFDVGTTYFEKNGELATVQVTLNYVSPIVRSFVLVQQDGVWRVNTIIAYAVPPMAISPDFVAADRVILAYVEALREKDPAAAWALLTADGESKVSEADIAAQVESIQDITPISITLIQDLQDPLLYQVILWVTVQPGAVSSWTAGDNLRWFEMVSAPEGWGIARVSSAAP